VVHNRFEQWATQHDLKLTAGQTNAKCCYQSLTIKTADIEFSGMILFDPGGMHA